MNSENAFQTEYDLCIVGSGPAGIILALEYGRLKPEGKVLLVEYGDTGQAKPNQLDNSIQISNLINHHAPEECTNKGVGGTSASWGGRCVMFDEIDFMERKVVGNNCTWDLALYHELNTHLSRTSSYFECGQAVFNLNELPAYCRSRIAEGFREGPVTDSYLERWSMPTRFGKRYAKALKEQTNLRLITGYEARSFSPPKPDGSVSSLMIREVKTHQWFKVSAKAFVLAAGTQETTRILLRNKQLFRNLNSVPQALGKFYQGHLSGKIAFVRFKGDPKKTNYSFLRDTDGTYLRRRFQFSTQFLLEQNLLNTAVWLDNPLYYDPKHRSGAMSFMYLAMLMPVLGKLLAPPAIAHSITKGKAFEINKHLWNILKDVPTSLFTPAVIFYKRYLVQRKLPGIFLYSPENCYALHFHTEQIPDASNRMELGPDGETLQIHYALLDEDVQSVIRLHKGLDEWLQKCDCGKLEYWYPEEALPKAIRAMSKDGLHQSGTTRIGDSPERGVVDRNLKLWGTENIFVCSSSVFPTSGQANPTYLIGAFSVRLAEHLAHLPVE